MEKFIYKVPGGTTMYFDTRKTLREDLTEKGSMHTIYDGCFAFVFYGVIYNAEEKVHYVQSMAQKKIV